MIDNRDSVRLEQLIKGMKKEIYNIMEDQRRDICRVTDQRKEAQYSILCVTFIAGAGLASLVWYVGYEVSHAIL